MKETRKQSRTFWIAFAACLVVAAVLPLLLTSDFAVNVLVLSLIWSIMGIGWNFRSPTATRCSMPSAPMLWPTARNISTCPRG